MALLYNNKYNAVGSEITQGKINISKAINAKGGTATQFDSFQELAEELLAIPDGNIDNTGVVIRERFNFLQFVCAPTNSMAISEIDDDTVVEIKTSTIFYQNIALQSVSMSSLQTISGSQIFLGCSALQSVSMSSLHTISGSQIFSGCSALQSVSMSSLQTIDSFTFHSCSALQSLYLPLCRKISSLNNFSGCSKLQTIEFGKLESLYGANQFTGDSFLKKITIGSGTDINLNFSTWSPTSIPSSEDAQFNIDFMSGIVDNLFDYSGGTAHTLTLSANVLGRLTQETLDALADKNWNVL